tara:strand:+ start:19766 stop:20365 length:600 start_codon:yes stop_codon:yes gene_type:complete
MIINDGRGSGRNAAVNVNNHLLVQAVMSTFVEDLSTASNGYNISSGVQTLAGAAASAVLYIKNNGERNLFIPTVILYLGSNTGGAATADHLLEMIRNPTVGTLVTGGTAVQSTNRNYGSTRTLDADMLAMAAENQTLTDGTLMFPSLLTGEGRTVFTGLAFVLPKGASIGFRITPKASSTNMDIAVAVVAAYDADGLTA